jgi:hypothetical protein
MNKIHINLFVLGIVVAFFWATVGSVPTIALADNPTPAIASLSPATISAGTSGLTTFTVNGTGFTPDSTIYINGTSRGTTYVSPTQLTTQLSQSDYAVTGPYNVSVLSPSPGGGFSNSMTYSITSNSPATPSITSIFPMSKFAGDTGFTLDVYGNGFSSNSTVQVNGSTRPTTFLSSGHLAAQIPAGDIATNGAFQVAVSDPAGGLSTNTPFTISPAIGSTTTIPVISTTPTMGTPLLPNTGFSPDTYNTNAIIAAAGIGGLLLLAGAFALKKVK